MRHDLISIKPSRWGNIVESHECLRSTPLVAGWASGGWPVVARRPTSLETTGVPVGLPLPPSAGKRRLSFTISADDILSLALPLKLTSAAHVAPDEWLRTLAELDALACEHVLTIRVFGSLAWTAITGMNYLTSSSDLDVLIHVDADTDIDRLVEGITTIEASSPMRLDGELIRDDGGSVNWREFRSGSPEVLLKSIRRVSLIEPQDFVNGVSPI